MSRYLTPLPAMLAAGMGQAIARALALDDGSGQRLEELEGRTILLRLEGLGIDLYFHGQADRLAVSVDEPAPPDTTISGSPLALLAMSAPRRRRTGRGVRIEGDAATAQSFERLLKQLDPDWQAALTGRFGPRLGYRLWRLLADVRDGTRHVTSTAADQASRFLRRESGLLVERAEVNAFINEVDELREAVDRLEQRLRRRPA